MTKKIARRRAGFDFQDIIFCHIGSQNFETWNWLTAQGMSMYVYKIRVKKNIKFFEIPAALLFYLANKNSEKMV